MKKKIISLLLALVMVLGLVACGGNNDSNTGNDNNTPNTNTDDNNNTPEPTPTEVDNTPIADINTQDAVDVAAFSARADELFEEFFGEFADAYKVALAEPDPATRLGLMAIAEAKLMETGIVLPYVNNAGNYAISRIIPHSVPSVSWGYDGDYRSYKNLLITDQLLTPDVRAELTAKWGELTGTGTWYDWAKQWAADNGYTLQDSYTLAYTSGYEPTTWDALSTNKTAVGANLSMTWEGLLRYNAENIQGPAMAESYEASADGLTYTFHIRPGMKWVTYQGTEIAEVTADDWVAALQHACDTGGELPSVIPCVENLTAYFNGEITDFSQVGIKALDDYTLQYTLSEVTPWFLSVLGYSAVMPMCREYYESQGGKFGAEFNSSDASYVYGTDPQHIAYCGPYLVSNYTYQNTIVYSANPSYWDVDNMTIKTVTFKYNDGTDTLFSWNNFLDGTFNAGLGLGSAALEQAKVVTVPDDPDGATYFDKYAYVVMEDDTSFVNWVNINRYAYANFNDESKVRSEQTVTEAGRTAAAKLNHNFRMALAFSRDRATVYANSVGEELKTVPLTNSWVPGSFILAGTEFTVNINGKATTFPAGTYYGEVLQAQIDADGYTMKVWDPEGNYGAGASYGFDGWYDPATAAAYMDKAVEELAAEGIEVSAENPIQLDYVYRDYSTIGAAMDQAMKQSIESALGGRVIINLISVGGDSDVASYATYYGDYGYQFNYDFGGSSGWGPDYGDAQTYLDTMLPGGGMLHSCGLQ